MFYSEKIRFLESLKRWGKYKIGIFFQKLRREKQQKNVSKLRKLKMQKNILENFSIKTDGKNLGVGG
jgi:Ran GTPase-activating protein (RanGAP) involved in mRNA processing and transport